MEIIARLTADAVVKTLKNERQVVSFDVAINDNYKPKGATETVKVTTYVQCSYWNNPGIAQYLTKGTLVELYGRIGVNAYVNGNGEAKASLTFHVNNIKLHGGSKGGFQQPVSATPVSANQLTEPLDDLPF
ncbi:MAG: single-stranded DNA-binding protein [Sediminibacterium sp.]